VKHFPFVCAASLAAGLLLSTTAYAQPAAFNEAMSYDGLQKASVKGVEIAYVRPGATLDGYTSVELAPVYVAFTKNWTPTPAADSPWPVSDEQRQKIKEQVATLVYNAFAKELQDKGGFPIVDAPGPHVLLVKVNIINLNITAPVAQTAGPGGTMVNTPGYATLYAELFDSETGQVLARVVDMQQADYSVSYYENNMPEAQAIATQWAKLLRDHLDQARLQLAKTPPVPAP